MAVVQDSSPSREKDSIKIWLIEDNDDYRADLVESFEAEVDGIDCLAAFPSYEALELHMKSPALTSLPDVVIMDIQLPGISGIEAIPRLKAQLLSVDAIMLTTFSDKRRVFDAICAGASGYLLKSDSIDVIERSIREVFAGGSSLNSQIAHMVLNMFSHLKPGKADHNLTDSELEILRLLSDGLQKKEIAQNLKLANHQVNYHVRNIYKKLQVNSLSGAVGQAIRKGYIK